MLTRLIHRRGPLIPSLQQLQCLSLLHRTFSLWSMKKDPDLESVLSRNRRWIGNNQIKNIILHYPNQEIPIASLQKKLKTLDLKGKALNWLHK
ncbi:uncharacterized protein DS421_13g408630 [Arachis hypogaea]|nr:uncharacterized protein DS421_13g408630 [Arachis hypogaea]